MGMTRREFLKFAAVGGSAAAFTACVPVAAGKFQIQSPLYMTEDLVAGSDQWFATLCRGCSAGCGVLVRVVEGRAKKIEGNPNHPVNHGKLCPRGEALAQVLYHPDRVTTPLRRRGDRGSGEWEPISWDDALNELVSSLKKLSKEGDLLLITEPLKGARLELVSNFVRALKGRHLAFEPLSRAVQKAVIRKLFGTDLWPGFDIANAALVVSFGADFLADWLSPVHYGFAYGNFRGREGARGKLIAIEPNFSLVAANADKWIPVRPGTEGAVALGLARLLIESGKVDRGVADALTGGRGLAALASFDPQKVEQVSGVPAKTLEEVAADLASLSPAIVLGGDGPASHTNGFDALQAIYSLNFLIGSVGRKGGILPPIEPPLAGYTAMAAASLADWEALSRGQSLPSVLVVHGADPVHYLPGELGLKDALKKVPYVVSVTALMDDTALQADLVLPALSTLEDWGDDVPDPGSAVQAYSFQQPVVRPVGEGRSFYDLLLTLASEVGGQANEALPYKSYREALLNSVTKLQALGKGSIKQQTLEAFLLKLQQEGVWTGESVRLNWRPTPQPLPEVKQAQFAGDAAQYPYYLVPFVTSTLGLQGAGIPWLEALPDPTTTVVWQTWVQISPQTARQLGLKEGDIVGVETPVGRLEAPVYIHPAMPPDVVAVPLGRGYQNRGRYARLENNDRSGVVEILGIRVVQGAAPAPTANPMTVVAALKETQTGFPAYMGTRARLVATGRRVKVLKMEGTVEPVANPEIVKISPPKGG